MGKRVDVAQAAAKIANGSSVMIGGFMCCGQPLALIDALIARDIGELTVISNDAGLPGIGVAKLIEQGRVKHLIASHIGLNPVAGKKMTSGEMKVDLIPQGTLVERIRAQGAGLGGILTPTGIGTEVEKGKIKHTIDGREYLIELPLGASFALTSADIVDALGNCFIAKARKNFNLVMAMAADYCIVEADKVVARGELEPDRVNVPGIFIKAVVEVSCGR